MRTSSSEINWFNSSISRIRHENFELNYILDYLLIYNCLYHLINLTKSRQQFVEHSHYAYATCAALFASK